MLCSTYLSMSLLLAVQAWAQQSITQCPTPEANVTTTDGSIWSVCPNGDYQVPSVSILSGIKSYTACTQLCQQYSGCTRAVYDKVNFVCHIKGNSTNLPWYSSSQYQSIRFVNKPVVGQEITKCPTGTFNTSLSDGSRWNVCPNSDYVGDTIQSQGQVTSETACAALCRQRSDCATAVYSKPNLLCHLKAASATQWTYNPAYETIRLIYAPQAGDVISSCPMGDKNVTSSRGLGYAICPGSQFDQGATTISNNCPSNLACMLQCDSTPGCTKAVYDPRNQVCFVKPDSATWTFDPNYDSIRLINGTPNAKGQLGKWMAPVSLPVVPAGAFIVPEQPISRRILAYSSWGTFEFSGATGITQFADYNWNTGAVSQRTVTETHHDMFCPGMSYLANGTLVVTGGENAEAVSFYNYNTNSWTRAADMKIARGYQSSTTLSDGRIFTIGGSFTGGIGGVDVGTKSGEVYDPVKNTWTLLPGCDVQPMLTTYDAEGRWRTDNHAWLYGWKAGSIFQAGPSKTMHWYDTRGNGAVSLAGTRDGLNDSMCGVNVMFDAVAGKIFSTGGSQSYTNSPALKRAELITINQPFQPATVEQLPDMSFPRGFANVVVLPNGQVIITGGQVTSLVFTDVQSIYAAELWDPQTKQFTVLAPAKIPRNYHSVSLLLADGTVWAAGGGLCPVGQGESTAFCDQSVQHFDGEIFKPPYLFAADGMEAPRPIIFALASDIDGQGKKVKVGGKLIVDMNDPSGATFALVRLGSATHSINTDQRRVPLSQVTKNQARYTIQLPADSGVLIPGYYYLFAMNNAGVPGVAWTVQVTN